MTSRQNGMTLVEVMISAVVLSMIMLGLVTAMRTFSNTYGAVQAAHDRSTAFREVSTFLRHSIREAIDVGEGSFTVSGTEMIWMAPLDRIGAAGGVLWMRLARQGDALTIDFAHAHLGDTAVLDASAVHDWGSVVPSQILLEGLESFSVSALSINAEGSPSNVDSRTSGLPYSVRIDWGFRDAQWPPLVVALDNHSGAMR